MFRICFAHLLTGKQLNAVERSNYRFLSFTLTLFFPRPRSFGFFSAGPLVFSTGTVGGGVLLLCSSTGSRQPLPNHSVSKIFVLLRLALAPNFRAIACSAGTDGSMAVFGYALGYASEGCLELSSDPDSKFSCYCV